MTADAQALARLHAAAFDHPRPWSAAEFQALLADPLVTIVASPEDAPQGFAVIRTIAGESELLTIAVAPDARGQGLGRRVLNLALAHSASTVFLEVASSNSAALQLYRTAGFDAVGRRPRYYDDGSDALILRRRKP